MILQVPDEQTLAKIFESEPSGQSVPKDGLWFYEITDVNGIVLELSFNIFERSIQTVIKMGNRKLQVISLEGAVRLLDSRNNEHSEGRKMALRGEFVYKNASGILEVYLKPEIYVHCSVLAE